MFSQPAYATPKATVTSLPILDFRTEVTESSRPAFEAQLLKELALLGGTEKELREEYLTRDPGFAGEYKHLDTQIEWTGWKRGYIHGYEISGKR